jgi:hypothetical protein
MLKRLALGAAALTAPGIGLTLVGERLIKPRVFYRGPWHPEPPDAVDWPHEEARIFTPDGLELQGWFFSQPQPSPTILFLHGTSYNASDMWVTDERASAFHNFLRGIRANFLVFDYRGYGRNGGTASEEGTYTDAAAALAWLHQHPAVDPATIFYYGFSLGTGVATGLALREPPPGLILRAPFTSVRDLAIGRHPRVRAALLFAPWIPLTNYDSLSKIRRYQGPLLVMHGDADTTVPEAMGQRMFEAAPTAKKRYVIFPNGGHSDLSVELLVPAITQFIDDVVVGEAAPTLTAAG